MRTSFDSRLVSIESHVRNGARLGRGDEVGERHKRCQGCDGREEDGGTCKQALDGHWTDSVGRIFAATQPASPQKVPGA